MENVDIVKEVSRSKLFLLCHNDEYYLVSGTLCQKCEGQKREAAIRLKEAMERIRADHTLSIPCDKDVKVFQALYQQFLQTEPSYSLENVNSASVDLLRLLERTALGESILTQRKQFFEIEHLVDEITAQA